MKGKLQLHEPIDSEQFQSIAEMSGVKILKIVGTSVLTSIEFKCKSESELFLFGRNYQSVISGNEKREVKFEAPSKPKPKSSRRKKK